MQHIELSLIHISEPTRQAEISYAVFCLKKNDLTMMADLDMAAVSYQIVLTKIDKLKKGALEKTIAETAAALAKKPAAHPDVLATSSEKGDGIDLVRAAIASLVDLSELGYKAS